MTSADKKPIVQRIVMPYMHWQIGVKEAHSVWKKPTLVKPKEEEVKMNIGEDMEEVIKEEEAVEQLAL